MKKLLIITFIIAWVNVTGQELKVSSFNVRYENSHDANAGNSWKNRCAVITNMILFHDLDVIGTQECLHTQINDLNNALNGYAYVGRGRGTEPTQDEYAAIFYKTDKFTLLNSGHFWLSQTPDIPGIGWDAALNRICTWGKFKEKKTGFVFFMFNLHMDHVGVEARKNSSELVIQKIKEIASDNPAILTGDFNVDQHSDGYKIITSSGLMSDSYLQSPIKYAPNGTFNAFNIHNVTSQRIDHVFVTKHFNPMRYGILTDIYWSNESGTSYHQGDLPAETTFVKGTPRLPSDHYPVVVVLKYQ